MPPPRRHGVFAAFLRPLLPLMAPQPFDCAREEPMFSLAARQSRFRKNRRITRLFAISSAQTRHRNHVFYVEWHVLKTPRRHGIDDFDKPTIYPSAVLFWMEHCAGIHMAWTGHLLLPDSKRPTIEDVAARLRELRKVTDEYIVSQAAPGTIPETRCFDPNNCCCFTLKLPSPTPSHLHPPSPPAQALLRT